MAYVALKQQPGPGGTVRQPGDHMPEADTWVNPKLWVSKGFVRWVPNADIVGGRWRDFEEFALSGAGGSTLKALALAKKAAPTPAAAPIIPPPPPPPPKDERPVARLPLLDEYVAAGYTAEGYDAFIRENTARAEAKGLRVEVRAPTAAEAAEAEERIRAHREEQERKAREELAVDPDQAAAHEALPSQSAPTLSKKDLESKSQPELLALARARGMAVDEGTGKGKLIKLLSKG